MKETWNVLDPDEYVKHNPFMGYTNMKIEKISPECSEISMKITHGVTNLMGMVHGGMLYALADVVTGLTARADGRKYVTQSAHINFIRNVSEGTVYAKGILIRNCENFRGLGEGYYRIAVKKQEENEVLLRELDMGA